MKFGTRITHNVAEDGKVKSGGAVITKGAVHISHPKGGCGTGSCNCSPGHWMSIISPRDALGNVEAMKITFTDRKEMKKVLQQIAEQVNTSLKS